MACRAGSRTMSCAGLETDVTANPVPPVTPIRNVEPDEGPLLESRTVIVATPTVVTSAALIVACNFVDEMKVVTRALPLNCTTDELVKFTPCTVKVKLSAPTIAEPGFRKVITGACGLGFGVGVGVGVGTGTAGGLAIGSTKFPATRTIWPLSVLKARPFCPQRIMRLGVPVTPLSVMVRFKVKRARL